MEAKNEFELEKDLVIISVPTIQKLLSYKKTGSDAFLLYSFYYYTAKWQKTNQPKATPSFCMKGLHWGKERFEKADKLLRNLNLIEKRPNREKVNKEKRGQITGWYVKINYIWTTKREREVSPEPLKTEKVVKPTGWENQEGGSQTTNALSVNSLNASSTNNPNALNDKKKNALSDPAIQRIAEKKEIDHIINLFKKVNPSYKQLFNNRTERSAAGRLLKQYGRVKLERIIESLPSIVSQPYAPTIVSPHDLEKKMANLIIFLKRKKIEEEENKPAII